MRRALCVLVIVAASVLATVPVSWAASDDEQPTTTALPPAPNIIPRPGEGTGPEDAGDRGGALQTAVFVVMIGGTALIAALVVRSSRKARAERGF